MAFAAADTFGAMLAAYRRKGKLPSAAPLAKMVSELSKQSKARQSAPRRRRLRVAFVPAVWTEYEKLAIQNAVSQGRNVYHVTAGIDPKCVMPVAARQLVMNALKPSGEVLATRPEAGSPESTRRLELLVASEKPKEQLAAQCRIPTVIARVSVELIHEAAPKPKKAAPAEDTEKAEASSPANPAAAESEPHAAGKANHTPALAENILRVDAERIDNVLNLVGELIIGRSMLQQAFTEFARHVPKETLRGRFSDAMSFQSRVLSDLQRSVMKIRMVPVEQLFRRFPRVVRDVAKQCGKDVELVISGQDTDLDKSLLDVIAEPLTHLVRNAVSHGIESPEERRPRRESGSWHHSSHFVPPRQSGDRRDQRRRPRHRFAKSQEQGCGEGAHHRGRSGSFGRT